jgi:hypothetical protein
MRLAPARRPRRREWKEELERRFRVMSRVTVLCAQTFTVLCDTSALQVTRYLNSHSDVQSHVLRHLDTASFTAVLTRMLHLPSPHGSPLDNLRLGVGCRVSLIDALVDVVRDGIVRGSDSDAAGAAANATDVLCNIVRT